MLGWDDYSIHDLVSLEEWDEQIRYMAKTLTAFKAVEKLYELKKERDQEAHEEHWIVLFYLRKLVYTFNLLRRKYLFHETDRLRIDKSDSGFVNFYEIALLETDLRARKDCLGLMRESTSLKEKMVTALLQGRSPRELFARMAENEYRKGLDRDQLFLFFNEGRLIKKDDGTTEKRKYLYFWGCYDKKTNRPYIYLLDFEQDREAPSLHESEEAYYEFMKVIRSEGSRAPAAGLVAMAIDQRLEHVHPKMLKRICIGPLYSQSFSVDLEDEISRVLEVGDEGKRFVFHVTEQFVFSIGQTVIQDRDTLGEILKGERVRERFYIPKPTDVEEYSEFNELEEQKASLIRKSVVMPYKLHQHLKDLYKDFKVISFTRNGSINGVE
ncbi:hypothetical protein [Desulfopila sp. IMCC35008]|uniref:hypothetical protein n=1 Tax=Desulfopila sp. IMCC35008 TaxID=2653858 RepID=UPI0013D40CAE|nr:hypothetical protein [Desulfopila sp. IMCC35008]